MLLESILIVLGVLGIGFLFAPLGLGGGILYVPLFHYVGGWEIDQKLIIVSLLLSAITSYGSGLEHRKKSYIDDELTGIALWGAIPGAMIGVFFVMMTGTEFKSIFKVLSVIVVGFVIFKMIKKLNSESSDSKLEGEVQIGKMTSLSAFGGFLSSVMAIGAGMIYVPAMKFFGNLETRKSIGSSLNIMMVVVPFAIVAHFMLLNDYQISQLIDESILLIVLIIANFSGSKFGAILGFRLFDESILMKVFIGVLSITWINYVIDLAI
ncbi:MAG: sulfite exporter TauE/SafE family protein [Candidatus Poseidoniaceae archaeon]